MRIFNGKVADDSIYIKIIRFKMDEDQIQSQIYFLTFVESMGIIFSQYKESCEVILDYPKIGGEIIKNSKKRILRIFCMAILMCTAED